MSPGSSMNAVPPPEGGTAASGNCYETARLMALLTGRSGMDDDGCGQ